MDHFNCRNLNNNLYNTILKKYPDVLDVLQVREILRISTKTIYTLIRNGDLKSIKVGRAFRIPKIFLLDYLHISQNKE